MMFIRVVNKAFVPFWKLEGWESLWTSSCSSHKAKPGFQQPIPCLSAVCCFLCTMRCPLLDIQSSMWPLPFSSSNCILRWLKGSSKIRRYLILFLNCWNLKVHYIGQGIPFSALPECSGSALPIILGQSLQIQEESQKDSLEHCHCRVVKTSAVQVLIFRRIYSLGYFVTLVTLLGKASKKFIKYSRTLSYGFIYFSQFMAVIRFRVVEVNAVLGFLNSWRLSGLGLLKWMQFWVFSIHGGHQV